MCYGIYGVDPFDLWDDIDVCVDCDETDDLTKHPDDDKLRCVDCFEVKSQAVFTYRQLTRSYHLWPK